MLNKIDIKPFEELSEENREILKKFQEQEGVVFHKTSNISKECDFKFPAFIKHWLKCPKLLISFTWKVNESYSSLYAIG